MRVGAQNGTVRVEILVRPNASRSFVGGTHDGALVVRVAAPPAEGRANRAALRALASAVGVRPQSITLVGGATSRKKIVEIATPPAREELLRSRLSLLGGLGEDRR